LEALEESKLINFIENGKIVNSVCKRKLAREYVVVPV
jgi:hypothetical protein